MAFLLPMLMRGQWKLHGLFMRRFLFVFFSLCCGLAFSSILPSVQYTVQLSGLDRGSGSSKVAACSSAYAAFQVRMAGAYGPGTQFRLPETGDPKCKAQTGYGGSWYLTIEGFPVAGAASCPANSVPSGSVCLCSTGYLESGGQCVDANAACSAKSGQDSIINFTVGYGRTPDSADLDIVGTVNQFPASGELCYQGCKVGASIGGPGVTAWRSQTPTAQGLYRLSLDLPAVQLGTACTADGGSSAPLRPDLPSPTCPGFVGEMNGKPGCYGTANSPVNVVPADRPPVAPVAGNPAAGQKPASGEGSGTGSAGRTPTTGNGGNAGGPASAGVGGAGGGAGGTAASGAGTKPTEDGKEQVACGAPGQPKCAIDESGTPKGKEDTAVADAQKAIKPLDDFVKNPTSFLPTFPTINWAFTLPTGCSPIALTAFDPWLQSIDICEWLPMFHDLMSFIWVMGGIFGAIGTFWRNTFSQG